MHIAVIGGGAAGFFAALSAKTHHPTAQVTLYEKSSKLLSKVRISGGGRCNVTHACFSERKLATHYPRGERFLRKSFGLFNARDTVDWFAQRGVELKTEPDGRMFPTTDRSSTIIDCLMQEAARLDVRIRIGTGVGACTRNEQGFDLQLSNDHTEHADRLIVTTGGHPKMESYAWLKELGHSIVPPVPSLFTFNMPNEPIRELMGVVADPARVRIIGTDLESTGPLLITHWGMSGPAILRLSAWGARIVHDLGYRFTVQVNWLGGLSEDAVRQHFVEEEEAMRRKHAENANVFALPKRLWTFLLAKAGVRPEDVWGDLPRKERNRLIDLLTNDRYAVQGKTTFKEEFVTAGGVSLEEVDPITMRSRRGPALYFAGEVLDIDGITGGFNFQAAWTTGFIAGQLRS
ncbi:MAG: NAD(P)/FAD-dependent oxidoreductase [Flavobacteriales bacterium]